MLWNLNRQGGKRAMVETEKAVLDELPVGKVSPDKLLW